MCQPLIISAGKEFLKFYSEISSDVNDVDKRNYQVLLEHFQRIDKSKELYTPEELRTGDYLQKELKIRLNEKFNVRKELANRRSNFPNFFQLEEQRQKMFKHYVSLTHRIWAEFTNDHSYLLLDEYAKIFDKEIMEYSNKISYLCHKAANLPKKP